MPLLLFLNNDCLKSSSIYFSFFFKGKTSTRKRTQKSLKIHKWYLGCFESGLQWILERTVGNKNFLRKSPATILTDLRWRGQNLAEILSGLGICWDNSVPDRSRIKNDSVGELSPRRGKLLAGEKTQRYQTIPSQEKVHYAVWNPSRKLDMSHFKVEGSKEPSENPVPFRC